MKRLSNILLTLCFALLLEMGCDSASPVQSKLPDDIDPEPKSILENLDYACSSEPVGSNMQPLWPGNNWRYQFRRRGNVRDTIVVAVGNDFVDNTGTTTYPIHIYPLQSSPTELAYLFQNRGGTLAEVGVASESDTLYHNAVTYPFPGEIGQVFPRTFLGWGSDGVLFTGRTVDMSIVNTDTTIFIDSQSFRATTYEYYSPPSFDVSLGEIVKEYYSAGVGRILIEITTENETLPWETFTLMDYCLHN